jgi:predicted AlkP superfamily phosphohydrolase/phosphomutase
VLIGIVIIALPRPTEPDPFAGAAAAAAPAAAASDTTPHERVVILGIDGMDPDILREVIERFPARMENFRWLIDSGDGIQSLGTSTPPQSPVAWSNFITGLDPGGHGIYDFLHRDLVTREPIGSTTKTTEPWLQTTVGDWEIVFGADTLSNRSGASWWSLMAEEGIPADVWRMPINFPVEPSDGVSFPGMLTPALDSAYGECTLYTTDPLAKVQSTYHKLLLVAERNRRIDTKVFGPEHPMEFEEIGGYRQHVQQTAPLVIYVDREAGAAVLEISGQHLVVQPGQWTDFVGVDFPMGPFGSMTITGSCRFYLRSIDPEVELYASPVNLDPLAPAAPVSEPADASAELAEAIGRYYTQGMAEDVNALKKTLITDAEFMAQADLVYTERRRMMDYALERYNERGAGGVLFFYYSTVDLCSHMMWRHGDPAHPFHDPELAAEDSSHWSGREGSTWKDTVTDLYLKMDPVLGRLREELGDDVTYIVMSDHGFAPYRRKFSLNTWLADNGYLVFRDGKGKELPRTSPNYQRVNIHDKYVGDDGELHTAVDWSKTRAYGMGFNGLYLNLAGRELDDPATPEDESGVVAPGAEAQAMLLEIKEKLEAEFDDATGLRPILHCDLRETVYRGERAEESPDLVIGYNAGYGNSDSASQGRVGHDVLTDNTGRTFNGSHLMAPEVVAGVLISNRPVRDGEHQLQDLTFELLSRFGVTPPAAMTGHRVLE